MPTKAELEQQVADLQREALEREAQMRKDFETVGAALHHEADNRDWCRDYDHFVENVNNQLITGLRLPVRNHVSDDATITVTLTLRHCSIEAEPEEGQSADERFVEEVRSLSIADLIDSHTGYYASTDLGTLVDDGMVTLEVTA